MKNNKENEKQETGDFLCIESFQASGGKWFIEGKTYKVTKPIDDKTRIVWNDYNGWCFDSISKYFTVSAQVQDYEVKVEKYAISNTDTIYTRNEKVLVRDSENDEWQERIFIIEHGGLYFCAIETHAGLEPFKFIKKDDSSLKAKLDEIVEGYKKIGIKLIATFE